MKIIIRKDFGENEMFIHTGKPVEACYTLPKVLSYSNIEKIILFGGGAKGSLWCQIIADITVTAFSLPHEALKAAGSALQKLSPLECIF